MSSRDGKDMDLPVREVERVVVAPANSILGEQWKY